MERIFARAGVLAWADDHPRAAEIVAAAIAAQPPGNAGWLLALEPLINVAQAPEVWAPVLAMVQVRAR